MQTSAGNWYRIRDAARLISISERTLRRQLDRMPANSFRRADPDGRGRPEELIHYTAHPALAAWHELNRGQTLPSVSSACSAGSPGLSPEPKPRGVSADDLVRARLRVMAVKEYLERRKLASAEQAALATCRDWHNHPRLQTVVSEERLPTGYKRKRREDVNLGNFMPASLRRWALIWEKSHEILDLADKMKGFVGRKEKEIPHEILEFVYGLSISTARSDIKSALAQARGHIPADQFPEVSIDTWRRRLKKLDRRGMGKDLMHSISRFRANQSPDVEIDWQQLPYNGRWEIDDVTMDWYGFASDLERLVRPKAYAIIRARTRKWVAFIATETPITQWQVRELVGFAMASSAGGIPGEIKFEHGTVAGDAYLDALLADLGVKVSRTSMDGGSSFPGAIPDRATGHFQGKALIESNLKGLHNAFAYVNGQTGPDERNTAAARLETMKRLAEKAAEKGEIIIFPTPTQWQTRIAAAMEKRNNSPHSGLPETFDLATGNSRHLTPNEMEQALKTEEVQVLDSSILSLFQQKGVVVDVTRNGFAINKRSYGRYDTDLQKFDRVLAFASEVSPDVAYVHELGRCVAAYEKAAPGDGDQIALKKHFEQYFRNQFDATMANALNVAGVASILTMQMTDNAVTRPSSFVAPPAMVERAARIETARTTYRARRAELDGRFDSFQGAPARRKSLAERSAEMDEHLAVIGG